MIFINLYKGGKTKYWLKQIWFEDTKSEIPNSNYFTVSVFNSEINSYHNTKHHFDDSF